MKKNFFMITSLIIASAFLFGCGRVRTYTIDEKRPDQNLSSGNMGYLVGAPSQEELNRPRKLTRKHYVAEVEIGKYRSPKKGSAVVAESMEMETVQEPQGEFVTEEVFQESAKTKPAAAFTKYTVLPNDTLGKISIKVYGTAKKWKKIYEANSDKLKSPDKIYAGQVLKIPQE